MDDPTLKQQTFDWKDADKYHALCNFKEEVNRKFIDKQLQYTRKQKSSNNIELVRP